MITKNCKACFGVIRVRLADHKRGWGNFCDKSCSAAYKCGQRPRDVNKNHTKYSDWCDIVYHSHQELYPNGKPPKQPPVHEQIGTKVKVKHKLHSPKKRHQCHDCGIYCNPEWYDGKPYCANHSAHHYAISSMGQGWQEHKGG